MRPAGQVVQAVSVRAARRSCSLAAGAVFAAGLGPTPTGSIVVLADGATDALLRVPVAPGADAGRGSDRSSNMVLTPYEHADGSLNDAVLWREKKGRERDHHERERERERGGVSHTQSGSSTSNACLHASIKHCARGERKKGRERERHRCVCVREREREREREGGSPHTKYVILYDTTHTLHITHCISCLSPWRHPTLPGVG